MAARAPRQTRKGYNYAKLNSQGKEVGRQAGRKTPNEVLEEGQIADSPLCLLPSDDDFSENPRSAVSTVDSRFTDYTEPHEDTELDYEDTEVESVVKIKDGVGMHAKLLPESADHDRDLGLDDVWQEQEKQLEQNRLKMDRLHKRLQ